MSQTCLIRYGAIPEIARFQYDFPKPPARDDRVVVQTTRGPELGVVLEQISPPRSGSPHGSRVAEPVAEPDPANRVLRLASSEDAARADELRREAQSSFADWRRRISEWKLELELIDLEWTLDRQKLVLYVLGGRGPETTRLALLAAAAGLAVIEVQPVSAQGLVAVPSGGGCGTGGCGCHT